MLGGAICILICRLMYDLVLKIYSYVDHSTTSICAPTDIRVVFSATFSLERFLNIGIILRMVVVKNVLFVLVVELFVLSVVIVTHKEWHRFTTW